jgi:large subunit ribosomal protein L10
LPTPEKENVIAELRDRITNSPIVVLTKFVGIDAAQATELRVKMRAGHVQLKVYKNTLAKRALDELDLPQAAEFMEGPTAWAFGSDLVTPPQILKEFNKEVPAVEIIGGILEGKVVSKEQIEVLASLPPQAVLLGQVVRTLAAPLYNLVGVLTAVPRNLVNVLDQVRKQKEQSEAAA